MIPIHTPIGSTHFGFTTPCSGSCVIGEGYYLAKGIVGYIIPHYFGFESEGNGVPKHFFRAYFINIGVFEILGKRYEIEPIAKELWRLHELTLGGEQ